MKNKGRIAVTASVLAVLAVSPAYSANLAPMAPVKAGVRPAMTPVEQNLLEAAHALRRGDTARAIEVYKPLVNASDEIQRAQARYGLALAFNHAGDDVQAVRVLEGTVADSSALGQHIAELRARLLLQLAGRALATGNSVVAQDWLGQYGHLTAQPDHDRYERLLRRATGSGAVAAAPLKVGVLVPLSGPLAATGEEIVRGLQLGLQQQGQEKAGGVVLAPLDTTPGAGAAVEAALAAGAGVIAGPLLGTDMEAVSSAAKAAGVPVIAFTTDRSVLRDGATSIGYLPTQQARAMADWAAGQGFTKVGALIPSSPYGSEVFDAFRDQAQKDGLTVAKSAFYNPQNVDLGASVRDLAGGKPVSGTLPFEAVFAPAPPGALPLVTSQLAYYDFDKAGIQLMGTGLWQSNELLKPTANGARGAVFAAPTQTPELAKSYADTFGGAVETSSGSAAVLGADMAYVLGEVAAELRINGVPVATTLARPEGFYAPGGYVRFLPNGGAERGLDIVKIGDNFTVLQTALPQAPLALPESLTPQGGRGGGWNLW
jgi:ABC-type branched-subunit amino acid transport system substrate-binding protein